MPQAVEPDPFPRSPFGTLLPLLSIIACFLCIPILAIHLKSHNLAVSVLISCIILENLINFINPLIWPTDNLNIWWLGYGLCDVEVKLQLAASMAYITAVVCIYRQLASILNTDRVVLAASPAHRRRRIAFEVALCFGFPIYIMIAHYLVQPSRYFIYALSGCVPSIDNSWVSVPILLIWPVIMWIVAAVYCALIIYRLIKYRREFSSILSLSQSRLNKSRFTRLFAMATTLIALFLPLALSLFIANVHFNRMAQPFNSQSYSWRRIHGYGWDAVNRVRSYGRVNLDRWIAVVTGYVVFVSFGFGQDAHVIYRNWMTKLRFEVFFPSLRRPRPVDASGPMNSGSIINWVKLIFGSRPRNEPTAK